MTREIPTLMEDPAPTKKQATRVQIDLNLAPAERWAHVSPQYKDKAQALTAYFETYIPKAILPTLELIAADLDSHFPADYVEEMKSNAKFLNLTLGEIVILNLIYQVEHIGQNCSMSNVTGPVPNCPPKKKEQNGPGLCTSVIAETTDGHIHHGRNLDWNIPSALREMVVDIEFTRGTKTAFFGSGAVGFAGLLHGAMPEVYSFSIDARKKGALVVPNMFQLLLKKGALTPAQHGRRALEQQSMSNSTFPTALDAMSHGDLVNPVYYIMGGTKHNEGAVVSWARDKAVDVWTLAEQTAPSQFFILQTNYDHWEPAPKSDDRRDYGKKHMETLGQSGVSDQGLYSVLTQWPTFNHHTDITALISAETAQSDYKSYIWS